MFEKKPLNKYFSCFQQHSDGYQSTILIYDGESNTVSQWLLVCDALYKYKACLIWFYPMVQYF